MSIQKCLPGLYPRDEIKEKFPASEKKVHKALKEGIPMGWYAWHSMNLRDADNKFTEADFVIADPARGILILEVKGGRIRKEGGHWYQNENILKDSPFNQVHRCRRILRARHCRPWSPPGRARRPAGWRRPRPRPQTGWPGTPGRPAGGCWRSSP